MAGTCGKCLATWRPSAVVNMSKELILENLPEHFSNKLRCFNLWLLSPSYYSTNQYLSEHLWNSSIMLLSKCIT
jgi:hypothetical protein